jgi:hypothetical protein
LYSYADSELKSGTLGIDRLCFHGWLARSCGMALVPPVSPSAFATAQPTPLGYTGIARPKAGSQQFLFFEQEEGLMELYKRETEGTIRAFQLHEITVSECRDALDSAMTRMGHRHSAQEIANLRTLMLNNEAKVAKEGERRASGTALSPRLCPKRDGAANHPGPELLTPKRASG